MRNIKKIVIHCTDSDDSLDIGFKEINEWHKERGWLSPSGISCGYHYVIRRNGKIEAGRPEIERGAHVKGHNRDSIGIVWVGRKDPSREQYKSLLALTRTIINRHNIDIENVLGHTELDHLKTCPNLSMVKFRGDLLFVKYEDVKESVKGLFK